jgi:hypothetical protein
MIRMPTSQTTFIAVLVIGAILLILSVTGNLNNANSLSSVVLFGVLILGFALYYDFSNVQQKITYVPQTTFKETITTVP